MKLEDIIKQKYGSVDNMVAKTDQISRAYIYKMVQGVSCNPTKDILKELSKLLELPIGEVISLIDEVENNEVKEV